MEVNKSQVIYYIRCDDPNIGDFGEKRQELIKKFGAKKVFMDVVGFKEGVVYYLRLDEPELGEKNFKKWLIAKRAELMKYFEAKKVFIDVL